MSYQALYRRYRPEFFKDVVGQEYITKTLKNQIMSGRIAHAYLFSGTRGTGKTSTAKIFARSVNCLDNKDGEPCGECAACTQEGESIDIIEIDAASNNGVDEIRDLRDKVRFAPLAGKYKVYIIDEVHMLSPGAFNALLKTLEEPPAHIIFILATTEPQKLPATILSRCQRYEFHRIGVQDMIARMKVVLTDVGASIEESGLHAIARAAEGGMRDALSLADQCIAFCGDHVTAAQVLDVLGSMDQDFMFSITDALLSGDIRSSLDLLDDVLQHGRDLGVFCRDLLIHFRALMLLCACKDARELIDCANETYERYRMQATCTVETTLQAIALLSQADADMKWMSYPRVLLESALVRICRTPDAIEDIDSSKLQQMPKSKHENTGSIDVSPIESDIPDKADTQPHIGVSADKKSGSAQAESTLVQADSAKSIFDYLVSKSNSALKAMFLLYKWDYSLEGNTLNIYAPSDCLPAIITTLSDKIEEIANGIHDKYPTITVHISLGKKPVATELSAREKAINLFGADMVKVN